MSHYIRDIIVKWGSPAWAGRPNEQIYRKYNYEVALVGRGIIFYDIHRRRNYQKSMNIETNKIPNHVAVIMDGNRRWATDRSLDPWKGHEKGSEVVEEIIDEAVDLKIPYFSFWGSSLDNIVKRSPQEVIFLLEIFKNKFREIARKKEIHRDKIKIRVLGRWADLFPQEVKDSIQEAIDSTKDYNNYFLNFFIAYSGKDEMMSAVKDIADKFKAGNLDKITDKTMKENLFTRELPPVDYLIRTGGNPHLSNGFMMWDVADAQLYFSEKLWPDFTPEDFRKAVNEYGSRLRKFGA